MNPVTQSAVNDIHKLREYQKIKPEIELMMQKAALFDELLERLNGYAWVCNHSPPLELVKNLSMAFELAELVIKKARAIK